MFEARQPTTQSSSQAAASLQPTSQNSINKFQYYGLNGRRGPLLDACQRSLLCIPPTSVLPERDFSLVNLLLGDHGTSMKPETLDDIFIMRKAFDYDAA